jgi:hypothetical protein
MSNRFRYWMLATAVSLAMWVVIISGSIALFNTLSTVFLLNGPPGAGASGNQVALGTTDTVRRERAHD